MKRSAEMWPRRRSMVGSARAYLLSNRLRDTGRSRAQIIAERLAYRLAVAKRPLWHLVTVENCVRGEVRAKAKGWL